MGSIGPLEIVLLGVVALLLFGPDKLPEIGRQLGKGMRDFRQSLEGTGIKEALDSVNEVRTAVSPVNAARTFMASGEESGAPPVAGPVVTPTALAEEIGGEPAAEGPAVVEAPVEAAVIPAEPGDPTP